MESYVDGGLLDKAGAHDRSAIMEMCRLAVEHLNAMTSARAPGHDDITPWLVSILDEIGAGVAPNVAFQWQQPGRGNKPGRRQSIELRDWKIRREVQDRMRELSKSREEGGDHLTAACNSVASDEGGRFHLSGKRIEQICAGLTVDTVLPDLFDLDLFPLPTRAPRRLPET